MILKYFIFVAGNQ